MLSRHDKDMDRRLRLNVRESVTVFVLINCFRRDASVDDLAEDAIHFPSLPAQPRICEKATAIRTY